jgi:hypothetical protein
MVLARDAEASDRQLHRGEIYMSQVSRHIAIHSKRRGMDVSCSGYVISVSIEKNAKRQAHFTLWPFQAPSLNLARTEPHRSVWQLSRKHVFISGRKVVKRMNQRMCHDEEKTVRGSAFELDADYVYIWKHTSVLAVTFSKDRRNLPRS